ncbi:MAG: glycosyltransferase [Anaerolineae bacterium]|nr:glycosyltransferase [Anaerolineae bacterium]
MNATGCEISVFAPSDEFSNEDSRKWTGVRLEVLERRGPAVLGFAPGLGQSVRRQELDLLHAQGLWMYPSVVSMQWGRRQKQPVVISPRGMLDPWAVRNSAWKKRIAGSIFEDAHLRSAACLHALCVSEYEAIRSYGLRNPVAVIPNGVDLPPPAIAQCPTNEARTGDERVLLFISRLHPKKGLLSLVRAWASAREDAMERASNWKLVIAGWDQGGHRGELERLVTELGVEASIQFVGPLYGDEKVAQLSAADAFVLPSHSEGLPMAVLEAWASGLPVLLTPGCNLPEGITAGAALVMEPNVESIETTLKQLFALSDLDRVAMGERGRHLVEERFAWPKVAETMGDVYRWLLGEAARPASVILD